MKTNHQLPIKIDALSAAMLDTGASLEVAMDAVGFAWSASLVRDGSIMLEATDSTPELAIAELNRKVGAL